MREGRTHITPVGNGDLDDDPGGVLHFVSFSNVNDLAVEEDLPINNESGPEAGNSHPDVVPGGTCLPLGDQAAQIVPKKRTRIPHGAPDPVRRDAVRDPNHVDHFRHLFAFTSITKSLQIT